MPAPVAKNDTCRGDNCSMPDGEGGGEAGGACPGICRRQRLLSGDAGACAAGRTCVFGHGWCREASHALPGLPQLGTCLNEVATTEEPSTSPEDPSTLTSSLPKATTSLPDESDVTTSSSPRANTSVPVADSTCLGSNCSGADGEGTSPAKTADPSDAAPAGECPGVCKLQTRVSVDPGAFAAGRQCVYGHGWCREASHPMPGLPRVGTCLNGAEVKAPRATTSETPTTSTMPDTAVTERPSPPPTEAADEPCPGMCKLQAGLVGDPGACTPGRRCVYGHGWCREVSHPLPLLPKVGTCALT